MGNNIPVITIDGASGTGKGVVCHRIARHLNWHLLDSGVLYRVLAYAAQEKGISWEDGPSLTALAKALPLKFIANEISVPPQIFLHHQNVTDLIRTETIGNGASKVGVIVSVREALLNKQRAFRQAPGLVTDGRDMGTVVFPDATLKIFLTASAEERASRRYKQLMEKGINVNLDGLIEELRERDKRDQERTVAPLKPAKDAFCIDTDVLTIDDVVNRILVEVKKVLPIL